MLYLSELGSNSTLQLDGIVWANNDKIWVKMGAKYAKPWNFGIFYENEQVIGEEYPLC